MMIQPDKLSLCGLPFNEHSCPLVFRDLAKFGIRYS